MDKTAALLRVTLAYLVAVAAALAWLLLGPDTGRLWLDGLIADVIATAVIFGFSRAYRNSSFYDAYWSVIPPLLALYWWIAGDRGAEDLRAWLVLGVITLWAVRLTGNWVVTWPGIEHEDWRYPMLRDGAGRWGLLVDATAIHLFPTLQVFLGMVPVAVVLTGPAASVGWLDWVAVGVGVGAVVLAFVADRQLHRFVRERQPGQVMRIGLWSWSRHPNYFGEISFWCALALFGLAAAPQYWWWLFVGVVAMVAMFLGASIPMMEKRSLERRPEYGAVIAEVSVLVPWPPRTKR